MSPVLPWSLSNRHEGFSKKSASGSNCMQFDEWGQEPFDEWEDQMYETLTEAQPEVKTQTTESGRLPEVEIGSSSDEDAPPVPESTQLARENLELRNKVMALMTQTKTLEQRNEGLKHQLSKYRTNFKSQIKSTFKKIWK